MWVGTHASCVKDETNTDVEAVSLEGVKLRVDRRKVVERIVKDLVSGKTLVLSNNDAWDMRGV